MRIVGQCLVLFSDPASLLLLLHHLPSASFLEQSIDRYELLTGWIGDDGVKQISASPWIICHIESTKIDDPAVDSVLSGRSDDPRLFTCGTIYEIFVEERNDNSHLCLSFVGHRCQSQILVRQNTPWSDSKLNHCFL